MGITLGQRLGSFKVLSLLGSWGARRGLSSARYATSARCGVEVVARRGRMRVWTGRGKIQEIKYEFA